MSIELKTPPLPESVADATVAKIYKQVGDSVSRDDNLIDLETDKVMIDVSTPASGVIETIWVKEGDVVLADQPLVTIKEGEITSGSKPLEKTSTDEHQKFKLGPLTTDLSPAVRRLVQEEQVDVNELTGSGKHERITKADVETYLKENTVHGAPVSDIPATLDSRIEERIPMSRLRAKIAQRLKQVQNEAAILTTFNEINMQPVMALRKQYREAFEKKHGVRLGLMSFFIQASIEALKRFPAVNSSIDGTDLIYHHFQDIGIAVGSERGLVVPIIRNAQSLSMAELESQISDFSSRSAIGKITIEEMRGGTFTITNGGVFGSMLSTPIINPPQSAILGMHNIVKRPLVEDNEIVIRPVMYVALSYDHRVIDGSTSVRFLYTIKELIEDPRRLLLQV